MGTGARTRMARLRVGISSRQGSSSIRYTHGKLDARRATEVAIDAPCERPCLCVHHSSRLHAPAAPSWPYDMPSWILWPIRAYALPMTTPPTSEGTERVRA